MGINSSLSLTRRALLAGASATSLLAATRSARAALPAAGLQVRPDIDTPKGKKMIELYAEAVAAMQEPEINYPPRPWSWTFQSFIHGVPANPFDPANSPGLYTGTPELKRRVDQIYGHPAAGSNEAKWKAAALQCWGSCTHASPYFTTWHRWYLHYFERIVRAMSNDASFMLPYWNYASDIGASLQLPAHFRKPSSPILF